MVSRAFYVIIIIIIGVMIIVAIIIMIHLAPRSDNERCQKLFRPLQPLSDIPLLTRACPNWGQMLRSFPTELH